MPNCWQQGGGAAGTVAVMKTRTLYWLMLAIAIMVATVVLAGVIVTLIPEDPDMAAASMQREVLEPKIEAIAESHRRGK